MGWLGQLLIGLALNFLAYLIMPKPNMGQPEETKDLESPTASVDRPVPVLFGSMTIKGPNIIYYTDKSREEVKV